METAGTGSSGVLRYVWCCILSEDARCMHGLIHLSPIHRPASYTLVETKLGSEVGGEALHHTY